VEQRSGMIPRRVMARLYCVRALGSLERGRVRSRVAWTLERGGVRSREREPSSEADFARGGHEPSSEADLARGGALLGCSSGPRGPSRRGLCCVHTFRGVFVFCAFLHVLSRTPPPRFFGDPQGCPRQKVVGVLGLGVVSSLDIPLLVANTSTGGMIAVLGRRGATDHDLPFVVRVVLQGDV
jgi:hypothetical protein